MARVSSQSRPANVRIKPPAPSTRARALAARKANQRPTVPPVEGADDDTRPASVPSLRKSDVLDRSRKRDIGTIYPPSNGAHFFQAGPDGEPRYFDAEGFRIKRPGDEVHEAAAAKKREEDRKAKAAKLRRQLAAIDAGEDYEEPDEDVEAAGVNLTRWGLHGARYRFGEVRRAIQSRFNYVAPNERAAIEFLIEQGVFSNEEYLAARRPAR